jgi:hypothetical protein
MTVYSRKSVYMLAALAVIAVAAGIIYKNRNASGLSDVKVIVYHDPKCSCCGKWINHMEKNGFEVENIPEPAMNRIKEKLGVPQNLLSCHTAIINDYIIEGHVAAEDIKRLLELQPQAHGLSVPGMPMGSPGMEYEGRRQRYDVLIFDKTGESTVFNSYSEIADADLF